MRLRLEDPEESNPSGMTGIEWYCEEDSTWHLYSMCTSLSFAQKTLEAFDAFNLLNSLTGESSQEVKNDEEVDTSTTESPEESINKTDTEESSSEEESKEVKLVPSMFTLSEPILEAAVQGH